ncbi:hypothetical protein ACFVQ3_13960 [Oerskovia sp. NPDC057915]|uniref:hypothetical protein n=1 Tax=Oerskovia sp. NPDC057915 TaxID=3346280 RepID=UPI0036D80DE2
MSSERPSETSPENTPAPRAPRRRALTWGAGALTFSVLTLGGLALSAPAGTGGNAPATDAGTGATAGQATSVTGAATSADDMTNVIEQR